MQGVPKNQPTVIGPQSSYVVPRVSNQSKVVQLVLKYHVDLFSRMGIFWDTLYLTKPKCEANTTGGVGKCLQRQRLPRLWLSRQVESYDLIRSQHSQFFFFRVSDGRYRRTNYRVIVRNLSSRTSWQVLFTLCTFIVSEYTYCHNSSVQNIVTNIVTNLLCRISLYTFPTARCCLDVPWPVVHVCPLGS